MTLKISPKEREKLFSRVDVCGPGDCWLWHGAMNGEGYGILYIDGDQYYVHRAVYRLYNDDLGDLQVNHHCDIKNCANPNHLYAGDKSDNAKDIWARGHRRSEDWRGEIIPGSVLTEEQAREIKRRLNSGEETHAEIAEDYPVTESTIGNISAGLAWDWVDPDEEGA